MAGETGSATSFGDDEIEAAAVRLEHENAERVLEWAAKRFAPRLALATGFGPEGLVLLDIVATRGLAVDVFTLDTGLFFPETYALWHALEARYGRRIRAVRPALSVEQQAASEGEALWRRDPDRCCWLRKVVPLQRALAGHDAWLAAIRRDQTRVRAAARVVERDLRHGLVKVNPLLRWSSADVWSYLRRRQVPTNPLHERGYPSLGCWPCTSRVAAGEDARAGRWRGREKTECGLHTRSDARVGTCGADERGAVDESRPIERS
jgi:phosphoadenosine phosphosulfate reductase